MPTGLLARRPAGAYVECPIPCQIFDLDPVELGRRRRPSGHTIRDPSTHQAALRGSVDKPGFSMLGVEMEVASRQGDQLCRLSHSLSQLAERVDTDPYSQRGVPVRRQHRQGSIGAQLRHPPRQHRQLR